MSCQTVNRANANARQASVQLPITSAQSHTSSSDEMDGDSLKHPASTCTASGISTNGGIANGSLGNPNSMWYWL